MSSLHLLFCRSQLLLLVLWISSSALTRVETTKIEEEFVEQYANFVSSGIWDPLIEIYNDTKRLERICAAAHNKTHQQPAAGEVKIYRCDQKNLVFSNPKYRPIDMEVIVYSIKDFNKEDGSPHYFYVGKGLAPDCVFYLRPKDSKETTFELGDHVCGIEI